MKGTEVGEMQGTRSYEMMGTKLQEVVSGLGIPAEELGQDLRTQLQKAEKIAYERLEKWRES